MAAAGLKIDVNVAKGLSKLAQALVRVSNLEQPAKQVALYGAAEARRRLNERPRNWGAHTGQLARSINTHVTPGGALIIVRTNLIYARIQEEGGTIYPKGKFLALPLKPSLRRSGTWPRDFAKGALRFEPAVRISAGGRKWIGPALVENEKGTKPQGPRRERITPERPKRNLKKPESLKIGKLAKRKATHKHKEGKPLFALIRRAKIQARPYLRADETIKNVRAFAVRTLQRFLRLGNG